MKPDLVGRKGSHGVYRWLWFGSWVLSACCKIPDCNFSWSDRTCAFNERHLILFFLIISELVLGVVFITNHDGVAGEQVSARNWLGRSGRDQSTSSSLSNRSPSVEVFFF